MTVADIPWDEVKKSKVLYVGGYLLMTALDQLELADVFRQARIAGVKTVLDVVLPGAGDHWSRLEKLLPHTDVFLPNTDEAALITGLDDPRKQAERFHEAGAGTVVITCGGDGTLLCTKDLRIKAEIYRFPYVGGTNAWHGAAYSAAAAFARSVRPKECSTATKPKLILWNIRSSRRRGNSAMRSFIRRRRPILRR
jgi:sugar/nucleoside kinase (ribokinase family)